VEAVLVVVMECSRNRVFRSGGDGGVRGRPSTLADSSALKKRNGWDRRGKIIRLPTKAGAHAVKAKRSSLAHARRLSHTDFGCSSLKCGLYEPARRIFGRQHECRKARVTRRSSMMVAEAVLNEAVAVRVR
jgi:hypothetical protein